MKFIGRSAVLFSFFLCAGLLWSASTSKQLMSDPLMALAYDPDSVKFEPCTKMMASRKGQGDLKQWIFAKCKKPNETLYVVSGWLRNEFNKGKSGSIEPDFGAVLRVKGKKVITLGTPDGLYGQFAVLPEADANCLMADAVLRYERAFGSQQQLQKIVTEQKVTADVPPQGFVEKLKTIGIFLPFRKGK